MNKILKKLTLWKNAGLISDSQFESIRLYEEEHSPKNLAAYTVITLGVIVICLGIISLIASNWEDLADSVKLLMDFTILGGLSYSIYRYKDTEKKWLLETLIISYFLLILASIGLISQIYNTGGKFYQAALFWCAITLPIVLHTTGRATTHIWFVATIFSVTSFFIETVSSFKEEEILLSWTYSLLPALMLVISFPLQASTKASLQVFGSTSLFWSVFGFLTGSIFFSFLGLLDMNSAIQSRQLLQGLLFISLLLSGVSVYLSYLQNKKLALLLLIGLGTYLFMFCAHVFGFHSQALDAFLFIVIWFVAGFLFHILESRRLFEFAIVSIGIRFLVAYFQLFTSLIFTAFGLIFSGILIIVVCVFYIKNRDKITRFIGELI
jgi:uncharacterized membrane protein